MKLKINTMPTSDKRKWFEIMAVVLTGALKYILMDWLELRVFYIVSVCLFWFLYIRKRYLSDPQILRNWGFRKAGFKSSILFILPFAIVIFIVIITYGFWQNSAVVNWHLIPVLLLYPAWGTLQQFMMIALIAGNLKTISSVELSDQQIIFFISILFSVAHYPDVPLMGFTFFMELLFLVAYFKYRNLWSPGLFHGLIGTLLLFFVMGRDVWSELWVIF